MYAAGLTTTVAPVPVPVRNATLPSSRRYTWRSLVVDSPVLEFPKPISVPPRVVVVRNHASTEYTRGFANDASEASDPVLPLNSVAGLVEPTRAPA